MFLPVLNMDSQELEKFFSSICSETMKFLDNWTNFKLVPAGEEIVVSGKEVFTGYTLCGGELIFNEVIYGKYHIRVKNGVVYAKPIDGSSGWEAKYAIVS